VLKLLSSGRSAADYEVRKYETLLVWKLCFVIVTRRWDAGYREKHNSFEEFSHVDTWTRAWV